jgi:subtilisin family serine protease
MKKILTSIFIGIFLISLAAAISFETNKVSPYIEKQLQSLNPQETVKVDVYLKDPKTQSLLSQKKINHLLSKIETKKISDIYEEAFTAELTYKEIKELEKKPEVTYIVPYMELKPMLYDSISITKADLAWQNQISETYLTGFNHTIFVIDTGVDFEHPDLAAKDILGGNLNCVESIDCPLEPNAIGTNSHGTHVAGIAGAYGEVTGIGKQTSIISAKVFPDNNNNANNVYIVRAINKAVEIAEEYNISAITISIGTYTTYPGHCVHIHEPMRNAIESAFEKNIPVTIATGNTGSESGVAFPSCMPKAIPVSATNKDDSRASYANYNPVVQVFAPGTSIYSTTYNNGHSYKTGTSMSAPMVAGALAILKQFLDLTGQTMNPHEMEALLFETGDEITNLPDNYKRININHAILAVFELGSDINQDGKISFSDLLMILNNWGECPEEETCPTDINQDGTTNQNDMDILFLNWNKVF